MRPFTTFLIAATLGAQIPDLPPDVVESRLAEAAEDRKNRNYGAAEESYRELLAQTGDARALRGLAALLFEQRRYSAAVVLIEDYSSKHPEDLPLRLLLGDAYSQSGRHDRAIETYRAILEKQPAAWQVWIRQGEAQKRSGNLDGALTSFEKARELAPASPLPMTQIAVLEESRGRYKECDLNHKAAVSATLWFQKRLGNEQLARASEGIVHGPALGTGLPSIWIVMQLAAFCSRFGNSARPRQDLLKRRRGGCTSQGSGNATHRRSLGQGHRHSPVTFFVTGVCAATMPAALRWGHKQASPVTQPSSPSAQRLSI